MKYRISLWFTVNDGAEPCGIQYESDEPEESLDVFLPSLQGFLDPTAGLTTLNLPRPVVSSAYLTIHESDTLFRRIEIPDLLRYV